MYRGGDTGCLIGPLNAWEVGDVIELPERVHPYLSGAFPEDTMPAVTVVVQSITEDGCAEAVDKAWLDAQESEAA